MTTIGDETIALKPGDSLPVPRFQAHATRKKHNLPLVHFRAVVKTEPNSVSYYPTQLLFSR